jgi:hypothetical protein
VEIRKDDGYPESILLGWRVLKSKKLKIKTQKWDNSPYKLRQFLVLPFYF